MSTLLEKALSVERQKSRLKYGKEEQDLSIAWAKGEVSTGQVCAASGKNSGSVYPYLAMALSAAMREGRLKESE